MNGGAVGEEDGDAGRGECSIDVGSVEVDVVAGTAGVGDAGSVDVAAGRRGLGWGRRDDRVGWFGQRERDGLRRVAGDRFVDEGGRFAGWPGALGGSVTFGARLE